MRLGKLERIDDLRSIWKHEAHDFTPWLAKEENLALQMFSFGIYAGIVIAGQEIEPILEPSLYDEANYKRYEIDQE